MRSPTTSFWKGTSTPVDFPALDRDIETDVAVIGGGITGITAATLLAREGKKVTVLEAMRVGLGTTGHSTGNLYVTLDEGMYGIKKKWGRDTARLIAASRAAVIDAIERTIKDFDIQCGLVRCPHFLYPAGKTSIDELEDEYRTLTEAGIPASITEDVPLPYNVAKAIRIENQEQFHPLMCSM